MAENKTDFLEHITPELFTPAWREERLAGIIPGYDAGFMIAAQGKVYFLWQNYKLRHNWDILFEADKKDVKAEWPRSYFGVGVRLTIDGKVYKILFEQRKGAPSPKMDWGDATDTVAGFVGLDFMPQELKLLVLPFMAKTFYDAFRQNKEAKRNTKAWREYLEM